MHKGVSLNVGFSPYLPMGSWLYWLFPLYHVFIVLFYSKDYSVSPINHFFFWFYFTQKITHFKMNLHIYLFSWKNMRRRTWRGCGCEEKWRRCRRFARRIVRTGRRGGCSAPPAELRRGPRRRSGCRTRKGTRTRHRRLGSPWFTELREKKKKRVKNWTCPRKRKSDKKSRLTTW